MTCNGTHIIGITGGIATGKTTFARILSKLLGTECFSADEYSGILLASDVEVVKEIKERVCPDAYHVDGTPDRARLRAVIFTDPAARRELEAILHPRIGIAWQAELARHRENKLPFFVSEVPLLFEAGLEGDFHSVVCVACSEEARLARLTARPRISLDDAKKMIASQIPLNDKIERSGSVVWNDGTLDALAAQAEVLANRFLLSHV